MDEQYKEVYFHLFCPTCKHRDAAEFEDPCNDCLDKPTNLNSHKPVCYVENK